MKKRQESAAPLGSVEEGLGRCGPKQLNSNSSLYTEQI